MDLDKQIGKHVLSALQLLEQESFENLQSFFENLHPAELSETLEAAPPEQRKALLKHLKGLDQLASIFEYGNEQLIPECLELIDESRIAAVARRLEADNASNMLRHLPRRKQLSILKRLPSTKVNELKTLLAYAEEMAGAIMTPLFISVQGETSCKDILKRIRSDLQSENIDPDTDISYLYVTDINQSLRGICSIRELLSAPEKSTIEEIMSSQIISVDPETDQEQVAHIIADYNFSSIPVCEKENNRLLGIVTQDDVIDVIEEETTEDILRLVGTEDEDTVGASVLTSIKSRLPWLLASWFGGIGGALLLGNFTEEIQKVVALTFFMPVVFGMGGNIGSQSTTITVRGIATGDLSSLKILTRLKKELQTSFLLGLLFGALLGLTTWYLFNDVNLCLIVSSSIALIMTIAATIGSMIPVLFQKLGVDPAVASGPLVTTSTDLLSILIYFSIASILLN